MTFPDGVISGAIHYFRVHPDLWRDRLERLAAMGLNTVETYVAWNFHSPEPGVYDFTGWRDIARFCETAREVGLNVILRPGPFICAEWDFGGLPAWLLRKPGVRLRCLDPVYMEAVDQWFDALLPVVEPLLSTHGGPVVAVQVENEYGSFGDDHEYLSYVRDGLVARGVDVPLFTSDGPGPDYLASGTIPGVLATVNFGSRVERYMDVLKKFRPGQPLMCMEFWLGWFDHWGDGHYMRDPKEAAGVLDDFLAAGAAVNLYMGHGGTNFGLWSGANWDNGCQFTTTSYDYDAPVGEAGQLTDKFWAFREVICARTGVSADSLPVPPPEPPRLPPQRVAVSGWAKLGDSAPAWGKAVRGPMPLAMEQVGRGRGLVCYEGEAVVPPAPDTRMLILDGLADRAYVYLDGVFAAEVDTAGAGEGVPLAPHEDGTPTRIRVIVENRGRVNFGRMLGDRKGDTAIRLSHRFVHGWNSRAIELDAKGFTDGIAFGAVKPEDGVGPVFAATSVTIDKPADGFLALPEWGHGYVWLNGFCLGRYESVGPQVTLYAPSPLWRAGSNELIVLEMGGKYGAGVEVRDTPDLGPAIEDE